MYLLNATSCSSAKSCRRTAPPVLDAPPTSHVSSSRWLYTPNLASSTRTLLTSLMARVEPREVTYNQRKRTIRSKALEHSPHRTGFCAVNRTLLTALPGSVVRAARNAAMLSVVPVQTTQFSESPGGEFDLIDGVSTSRFELSTVLVQDWRDYL